MSTSRWLRKLRSRLLGIPSGNRGRKPRYSSVRLCLEPLEERLVLDADAVQTVAANVPANFSATAQTLNLTATVKDTTHSSTTVNEGTVTFTVKNSGGTQIGTSVSGTVNSTGTASANFSLPASEPAGNYTIGVSYNDTAEKFDDEGDTPGTLAVSAANTTTTASNATTTFSTNAQNVTLSATVTSAAGTVNAGSVTFTILQGTTVIGTATSKSVSNGSASVSYALPAGTDAGSYTIDASYTDNGGNFATSSDKTHSLTVTSATAAGTTTTASNATATFSPSTQNVTLSATVTSAAGTVNEGSVTFTILQGATVIGTATSKSVSNGSASVSYALPAGLAPGSYTIEANYSDSTGKFAISSDTNHTLAVSAASTTTTASNATAPFSTSAQNVTLSATVTSPAGTVNAGSVTFTILQGTTVIGTATSKSVSNGSASVSYALPAGTDAGSYTIDASYTDNGGNFAPSSDKTHTLSVTSSTAAATTTAASNATATFSTSTQNVTLSATVTSSAGTVNEGSVTFTILQGTTVIGTATSKSISNGSASVSYALPAGTAPGSYTIEANYSDSTGKFAISSDTTHSLAVAAASTTVVAGNAAATFSTSAQSVTLSATVTSSAGTVNEGSVSFRLVDGNGNTIGIATSGNVSNGSASVSYALPAGTAAGSYTIEASYTDSSGKFATGSDNTHTLSVQAAATTTTASSATTSFSSSGQNVTLNATVTSSAGTVNEGSITFTLFDGNGNMIGTAISGNVSNGSASVNFLLPGGTAVGSYSIHASYSDSAGNFAISSDNTQTVTISTATATTVSLTTASIVPNLSNATAQVTLTVQVSNAGGIVNEGVLSITFDGATGQGNVGNGTVTVQLTVPLLDLLTASNISLSYSDAGPGNFANANASQTLATNIANALLPSTITFAADGSEQIEIQMGGQSVLGFSYTGLGLPTQINLSSLILPVTYANIAGNEVVSIDGIPWQVNFFNSNGQYQGLATLLTPADGPAEWLIYNASGQPIGVVPT